MDETAGAVVLAVVVCTMVVGLGAESPAVGGFTSSCFICKCTTISFSTAFSTEVVLLLTVGIVVVEVVGDWTLDVLVGCSA